MGEIWARREKGREKRREEKRKEGRRDDKDDEESTVASVLLSRSTHTGVWPPSRGLATDMATASI